MLHRPGVHQELSQPVLAHVSDDRREKVPVPPLLSPGIQQRNDFVVLQMVVFDCFSQRVVVQDVVQILFGVEGCGQLQEAVLSFLQELPRGAERVVTLVENDKVEVIVVRLEFRGGLIRCYDNLFVRDESADALVAENDGVVDELVREQVADEVNGR